MSSGKINRVKYIATSAKTYIKRLVEKIERIMSWDLRKYNSPKDPNYYPERDKSELLSEDNHTIYRIFIGSLNWTVTLGRYDVQHSVTILAQYSQLSRREGHLLALKRVLFY